MKLQDDQVEEEVEYQLCGHGCIRGTSKKMLDFNDRYFS
jgi:hypothetical protein